MESKPVSESELAAIAVAPWVTSGQIQGLMEHVSYRFENPEGTTSTFCHAFLNDKFYLATGHSASVSLANFNPEIGGRMAQANAAKKAESKLWELEGYSLFKQLANEPTDHVSRMTLELMVLSERVGKLEAFTKTPIFTGLEDGDKDLMETQLGHMQNYMLILSQRLSRSTPAV